MPIGIGLGTLMAGALGAGASLFGQHSANQTNQALAQKQMDFQKEMSSTAWQRGVEDMKKAGINPMLAYMKGGASTPGGAMAKMENVAKDVAKTPLEVAQMRNLAVQNQNIQASTAKLNAEKVGIEFDNMLKGLDAESEDFIKKKSEEWFGEAGPTTAKALRGLIRWFIETSPKRGATKK